VADADPDIELRRAVVGGLAAPSNAVERASGSLSAETDPIWDKFPGRTRGIPRSWSIAAVSRPRYRLAPVAIANGPRRRRYCFHAVGDARARREELLPSSKSRSAGTLQRRSCSSRQGRSEVAEGSVDSASLRVAAATHPSSWRTWGRSAASFAGRGVGRGLSPRGCWDPRARPRRAAGAR
jgi:hypothetical protein